MFSIIKSLPKSLNLQNEDYYDVDFKYQSKTMDAPFVIKFAGHMDREFKEEILAMVKSGKEYLQREMNRRERKSELTILLVDFACRNTMLCRRGEGRIDFGAYLYLRSLTNTPLTIKGGKNEL